MRGPLTIKGTKGQEAFELWRWRRMVKTSWMNKKQMKKL